jgi:broad specificity phosphatase PhoE
MKTILYYVRHGKREFDGKTIAGALPFKLNAEGKQQIQNATHYLSNKKIKAIYASPIKRTYESASIISKAFPNIKPIKSEELWEWKSGTAGRDWKKFKKTKEWQMFLSHPTQLKIEEPIDKVASRMEKFCKKLLKKHKGGEIICVSHQDPISALRLRLQNKSLDLLKKVSCAEGSITIFYFNNNKLVKTRYLVPKWS